MTANVWDKNTVLVVMSSTSHNSQLTALAIDSTNGSEQHQQLYSKIVNSQFQNYCLPVRINRQL